MSAILGRIELSGAPADGAQFLEVFGRLASYGPDLSESWVHGSCAIGRHLLRIGRAAEQERLTGPHDDLIVVADAVLDNRNDLADEFGLSPGQMSEVSDSDLVRMSFLRWGEACLDRLLGDFAFAALRPQRGEVFLARDHIGSRPLYWSKRKQTLIFSTSIEGIVAFGDFRWQIDERVVAEYLFNPLFPVSKPFFKDVFAVPAGWFLTVREKRVAATRWWRPSTKPERMFRTNDDAVAACRSLLEQAVKSRTNCEGPIGAHFSGGMDSTGVTMLASRSLRMDGRHLTAAYTWSPPPSGQYPRDHPADERQFIQERAASEDIPIRFGSADSATFAEFLRRRMEVENDADLADELPVLRLAQNDGLRIMLSGWGGDEAFSSHATGYLSTLITSGKFESARQIAHSYLRSLKNPVKLAGLLWAEGIYPLLPTALYRRLSPYRSYVRQRSFISSDLLRKHHDLIAKRRSWIKFGPDPNENLKRHVTAGHITMRMESWAAWSASYGFQYRYPLTDRRLLEFLFTLPPDQLFMNNQPRGLARAVLADIVPPSASKRDMANEQLRRDTRFASWNAIAEDALKGGFADPCPWLDKNAFLTSATHPADQNETPNVLAFAELYAAARVWAMYRRASKNGWLG